MKKFLLIAFTFVLVVAIALVYVARNKTATELEDGVCCGVPYIQIRGAIDRNGVRKISEFLNGIEESDAGNVILIIDSPGGEVSAGFDLSDRILQSKIRTYCLVREGMGIALYAVASADVVYFTKEGTVGSVEFIQGDTPPEMKRIEDKVRILFRERLEKISSKTGIDFNLLEAMTESDMELIREGKEIKKKGVLLLLDSDMATQLGFSSGTIDTIDELAMRINQSDNKTGDLTAEAAPHP